MPKFRAHVIIIAADKDTAMADLKAMSQAYTNKSVQPQWIEEIVG